MGLSCKFFVKMAAENRILEVFYQEFSNVAQPSSAAGSGAVSAPVSGLAARRRRNPQAKSLRYQAIFRPIGRGFATREVR